MWISDKGFSIYRYLVIFPRKLLFVFLLNNHYHSWVQLSTALLIKFLNEQLIGITYSLSTHSGDMGYWYFF